jgi:photosystem II stability/assembly factor-like uncharacterized protein
MSNSLLIGSRKGLLQFERGDGTWHLRRVSHRGVSVPYAVRDPRSGVTWASLEHGHWAQKLERSRDGGETWEKVPGPQYPEGALLKEDKPATLRYLWCLQPGSPDQPERFYIGTEPGGLFKSDDGGDSFSLVSTLWDHPSRPKFWFGGGRDEAGIHSILVDPRDDRRVLVGISCAGVFETTDGGATWTPRNRGLSASYLPNPDVEVGHDPHCISLCAADPDVLWQQNHDGLYRSTDGARAWTALSEAGQLPHFGFVIAADPQRPETAWVVPAVADEERTAIDGALCVCRTDDGGRSWSAFRAGLPQTDCFDLVYRHGMDVSGYTLAFGSTSGSLFVSDDRGESWSCLGQHLPPIYSVRFA